MPFGNFKASVLYDISKDTMGLSVPIPTLLLKFNIVSLEPMLIILQSYVEKILFKLIVGVQISSKTLNCAFIFVLSRFIIEVSLSLQIAIYLSVVDCFICSKLLIELEYLDIFNKRT